MHEFGNLSERGSTRRDLTRSRAKHGRSRSRWGASMLLLAVLAGPWLAGCDMGTYESRYADELQKHRQIQAVGETE